MVERYLSCFLSFKNSICSEISVQNKRDWKRKSFVTAGKTWLKPIKMVNKIGLFARLFEEKENEKEILELL